MPSACTVHILLGCARHSFMLPLCSCVACYWFGSFCCVAGIRRWPPMPSHTPHLMHPMHEREHQAMLHIVLLFAPLLQGGWHTFWCRPNPDKIDCRTTQIQWSLTMSFVRAYPLCFRLGELLYITSHHLSCVTLCRVVLHNAAHQALRVRLAWCHAHDYYDCKAC